MGWDVVVYGEEHRGPHQQDVQARSKWLTRRSVTRGWHPLPLMCRDFNYGDSLSAPFLYT